MPGGRPKKTLKLIEGHRTNEEKKIRENSEASLLTGTPLKENPEVKSNTIAHKEFLRLKKLLQTIKKDDDIIGNIINTHCMLVAECKEFEKMKDRIYADLQQLGQAYTNNEIEFTVYIDQKNKLQDKLFSCDKKIMEKRKMMLDISKENIMTLQSAMRAIPTQEPAKKKSAMSAFLERKQVKNP